ncbi:hypothetical protein C7444_1278 [Sphaerotilus hippei]|uniref:DUF2059 domain-containing protein n=1 Tax=Sphaerotilus hippei TaxID=744406 RepID=A0A318GVP0_9BURK|nr:DUF2059 domain-containing protein [Sphaerotilus hippei]PXW92253.1 hypothetical protein C7444_1278 [Sphaerotilus hippei]
MMSVRGWMPALLCVAAALAGPVRAADEPSAARKELVQKVIQLHQGAIENVGRGLAETPVAAMMQRAGPVLQERFPADKREAVAKQIQADAKKYVDETAPMLRDRALKLAPSTMGPIFEQQFSDDDLRTLIAWLESPVSRKYSALGPELQKGLIDKVVAETRGTVEPRLQALERSVARRLGLEPKNSKPDGAASAPARK